ncbi:ATP-dependent endonuclease [Pedobacter yulinensis]|uniref:ATP-dependent endonuclease n=1 Tax=Pedobacter yulinensis TaxID=2126353 RepID=A0A2T3HJT6_9SPHI|nr:AAA family ATPase [Pedobacter yulinensis]PST82653.1 ATP-dependent endonuclease [Pedobacter yulinensis]
MSKAALIAAAYPFTPTAEQLTFCSEMAAFLDERPQDGCFVLRGYAGTGKTTSLSALVRALRSFGFKAELLAPTGRAAKVMGNYSGRKAFTIHKRIYRKRSAVGHDLAFQLAPNLAQDTLFIVDEASMIADERNERGSSLLADLLEFVYNDKNCLLLFVGDTGQLPPVGSAESPALQPKYLKDRYDLRVRGVELKEVLRQQKQSGILRNATLLRNFIRGNKVALPRFVTKDFSDIFRMTGHRMVEGLEYAYREFGEESTLVVCRSNKSANTYNNQIRARLLYREEELTGGDRIMIVKNNYFWLPENEEAAFIANGDMARIIRVRGEEERYGLRFMDAQIELSDFPAAGIVTCKVMLDTLQAETPSLPYEAGKRLYEGLLEDYAHLGSRAAVMRAIKEDPFYNALQIKFSYAVTCHKAQGGQWDAVFVDQGYLTEEMIDLDFLRWLYTAITRARKQLYLVNFAPNFFGQAAEEF